MLTVKPFLLACTVLWTTWTITVPPASAQTSSTRTVSFAEMLDGIWAKKRGTFLAVLPRPMATARYPESAVPPDVTELIDREKQYLTRRFGTVTVLAPTTHSVYSKSLRPVSAADVSGDPDGVFNPAYLFLSVLSRDQWKSVASGAGIGYADLQTEQQRRLWEKLIPNPFAYRKEPVNGESSSRLLTDAERSTLRYRVTLRSKVYAGGVGGETKTLVLSDNRSSGEQRDSAYVLSGRGLAELLKKEPPPKSAPPGFSYTAEDGSEWRYNQRVVETLPNRPKPGDIDYEIRGGSVSILPNIGQPVITVGEVMERIRSQFGLVIYAHKSLEGYAMVTGGTRESKESVPLRELLPALCYAVSGTVRRVPAPEKGFGDVYVVTRDLDPLAVQQDRVDRWQRSTDHGTKNGEWNDLNRKIAEIGVLPLLSYEAGDYVKPSPALRDRYAMAWQSDPVTTGRFGVPVPRTELPPAEQIFLSEQVKYQNDRLQKSRENGDVDSRKVSLLDANTYWIDSDIRSAILFPGEPFLGGNVSDGYLAGLGNWLLKPPARETPPISVRGRVLCLRATTAQEAVRAVRLATKAGAVALWLDAPPDLLAVAVRAAAEKLPVLAAISLWSAQDAPADLPRDENVRGVRSDRFLIPDDQAVMYRAATKLRATVAVTGIRGIVLRDVLPPGYRGGRVLDTATQTWTGESGWRDLQNNDPLRDQLGYGALHRQRYLARHGMDPADILSETSSDIGEGNAQSASPFRRSEAMEREWLDWKRNQCASALRLLRVEAGYLPVFLQGETLFRPVALQRGYPPQYNDVATWFTPWKAGAEPPLIDLYRGASRETIPLPDAKSGAVLAVSTSRTKSPASELTDRTGRGKEPALTLVDWSHRTLDEVEAELGAQNPTAF
ncbi:MAG: hypothetical protein H7145_25230 [Akkermansiaceae bacterium]|nr:hypothetical protein [Armatimonadota bacterium]